MYENLMLRSPCMVIFRSGPAVTITETKGIECVWPNQLCRYCTPSLQTNISTRLSICQVNDVHISVNGKETATGTHQLHVSSMLDSNSVA
jgi:hypothetical protein